jgi:hypothetical protein
MSKKKPFYNIDLRSFWLTEPSLWSSASAPDIWPALLALESVESQVSLVYSGVHLILFINVKMSFAGNFKAHKL